MAKKKTEEPVVEVEQDVDDVAILETHIVALEDIAAVFVSPGCKVYDALLREYPELKESTDEEPVQIPYGEDGFVLASISEPDEGEDEGEIMINVEPPQEVWYFCEILHAFALSDGDRDSEPDKGK